MNYFAKVLILLVVSLSIAVSSELPVFAGNPNQTPLGYGETVFGVVDDPIFMPFEDEFIITSSRGSTSYYFPSNGDGTFGAKSAVRSGMNDSAAIADFDGDSDLDFVLGIDFDIIVLYRNDGGGLFNPVIIASNAPAFFHTQMRAADFNRDGKMDFTSGTFHAFLGGTQRVYPCDLWRASGHPIH